MFPFQGSEQDELDLKKKDIKKSAPCFQRRIGSENVSRCGLAVWRLAGKQKDLGSIRFGSPFSSIKKIVVYGHCLVTLPTQLMKH